MQGKRGFHRFDRNMAMLGHELYSVLNGIQGMTELLDGTRLNGEQKQFLDAVKLSIGQMHWLIDGITSQQQGAPFLPSPDRFVLDGPGLLEQAVRCHSSAAREKNNLLLLVIDPQLPQRWNLDVRLLRQIIDNLLANAIKFTQDGRVVLEARPASTGQGSERGLELLIRDNGIGFDQAASQRIFEPFVQAGPDIGRAYGGHGLGLYICRSMVSRLNGQLDCISKPGSGSLFSLFFPDAIESQNNETCLMTSGLLSSLICHVVIDGELGRSLESLLVRLGIQLELCPGAEKRNDDVDFRVEISSAESGSEAALASHSLIFTPFPPDTGSSAGIRKIQPPFLTSTLGPLLMEMELERRLKMQYAG